MNPGPSSNVSNCDYPFSEYFNEEDKDAARREVEEEEAMAHA
jgi:hypothetical protein